MKLRLYDIFDRMIGNKRLEGENTTTLDLSHCREFILYFNYR
jgi:hypothetical protein